MSNKPKKKKSQQKGFGKNSVKRAQDKFRAEQKNKKKDMVYVDDEDEDEKKEVIKPKIYQNRIDGEICSDFINHIMANPPSWTRVLNTPVKHIAAFKSPGFRLGDVVEDEELFDKSQRFNAGTVLFGEFHLHSEDHKEKDKVRIFSADPPISNNDYHDFESDIQPCPPQSWTDNERFIRLVEETITKSSKHYSKYRPKSKIKKAKVGFYNDYDDYNYANQQSVAAVNHDFYQEFGIEASVESQLLVYGVISLLCFVCLCLLYLIIAAVSFLMGIWYERSNNNKEKNEPYIDEV